MKLAQPYFHSLVKTSAKYMKVFDCVSDFH